MDHSQVAIQADTAQETDADVDVLIEQEAAELTQPLPVTPVIILKHTWNRLQVGARGNREVTLELDCNMDKYKLKLLLDCTCVLTS